MLNLLNLLKHRETMQSCVSCVPVKSVKHPSWMHSKSISSSLISSVLNRFAPCPSVSWNFKNLSYYRSLILQWDTSDSSDSSDSRLTPRDSRPTRDWNWPKHRQQLVNTQRQTLKAFVGAIPQQIHMQMTYPWCLMPLSLALLSLTWFNLILDMRVWCLTWLHVHRVMYLCSPERSQTNLHISKAKSDEKQQLNLHQAQFASSSFDNCWSSRSFHKVKDMSYEAFGKWA